MAQGKLFRNDTYFFSIISDSDETRQKFDVRESSDVQELKVFISMHYLHYRLFSKLHRFVTIGEHSIRNSNLKFYAGRKLFFMITLNSSKTSIFLEFWNPTIITLIKGGIINVSIFTFLLFIYLTNSLSFFYNMSGKCTNSLSEHLQSFSSNFITALTKSQNLYCIFSTSTFNEFYFLLDYFQSREIRARSYFYQAHCQCSSINFAVKSFNLK